MNVCEAGHKAHIRKTVATRVGPMVIYDWEKYMGFKGYCTGQDDVSKTLDLYARWDDPEADLIERLLKAGNKKNAFVDIGAHVGYFSTLAQKYNYPIYAYEGDPENADLLKINVPTAQVETIWFGENMPANLWKDQQIEIMKIDIEGNERFAIDYFWKQIEAKMVKNIIIEISPTFNSSYPELLNRLREVGYHMFELDGHTPFNNNWDFSQKDLWLCL